MKTRRARRGCIVLASAWGWISTGCGDDATSGTGAESSTGIEDTSDGADGSSSETSADVTTSGGSADDGSTTDAASSSSGVADESGTTFGSAPPLARDDDYLTNTAVGSFAVEAVEGLLANDEDPDGDMLAVTQFDAASEAMATVSVEADGAFSYSPGAGRWGPDAFGYGIEDPAGGMATATVRIMVAPTLEDLDVLGVGERGFTLDGEAAQQRSGWSVSGGGDVDGDGFADLVVGAPLVDDPTGDEGRVYVVSGGPTSQAAIALADVAAGTGGFAIFGATAGERAGSSVALAGDVDGDGLADVVVGAPGADSSNAAGAGRAYVVFGKADTSPVSLDAVAAGTGGFVIEGVATDDETGDAVAGAGDVDGDGLVDIVVGAPGANVQAGRAYVVFGKATGEAVDLADIDAGQGGGFALVGAVGNDRAGGAVAGGGDVNADGLDDVVIGAEQADAGGGNSGRVYVVWGRRAREAVSLPDVATGDEGFVIEGQAANDLAGSAVALAGDVNGDGRADVVVGAHGAESSDETALQGRAYVVHGKSTGAPVRLDDVADGSGGFMLEGESLGDLAGWSVAGVGDLDGDGLADLLVGAQSADYAATGAGRTYVVYGTQDTAAIDLSAVPSGQGGFALDGVGVLDVSGWSVARAGDVDGDAFVDLILGAYRADPNGTDSGQSYVVYGGDYRRHVAAAAPPEGGTVTGTPEGETLVGGAGPDRIEARGGPDVVRAGPGDDVIVVSELDFFRLDGGSGEDTLVLEGSGSALSLGNYFPPALSGIERIDLTGRGDNQLFFSTGHLGRISDTSNALTILGDAGDQVIADLTGAGFAAEGMVEGMVEGFDAYSNGVLTLFIERDVELFLQQ